MNPASFTKACHRCMTPLCARFNFVRIKYPGDEYIWRTAYSNNVTGIVFEYHVREDRVFLKLSRVLDGKINDDIEVPPDDEPMNTFHFSRLWHLRSPETFSQQTQAGEKSIGKRLQNDVAACFEHAQDVLKGDFSVFATLEAIVRDQQKRRFMTENEIKENGKKLLDKYPSLKRFVPKAYRAKLGKSGDDTK